MKDIYGNEYEKFKGQIWISKSNLDKLKKDAIGLNIAIARSNEDLKNLAYEVVTKDTDLEKLVWNVLKSFGWNDRVCTKYLSE